MILLGLTGGIGMGKTTVAAMFARLGVPIFDADAVVHHLQAPGGRAIPLLAEAFPGCVQNGVLQRAALRELVFADPAARHRLEAIMHPLVVHEEALFRAGAFRAGRRAVLLDVPLLFESGGHLRVDHSITVSAPRSVQRARILARGIPPALAERIIATQMPDVQKRRLADYVIPTGLDKFHTWRAVRRIMQDLS